MAAEDADDTRTLPHDVVRPDVTPPGARPAGTALPRLVLVHGFTQNRRCWSPFDRLLARHLAAAGVPHELVAVDLPGHGDAAAVDADFATTVALLGGTGGRATYLGYSMGGRVALALACVRPDLVERLVLLSASPGLATEAERAARRAADDALAVRLERAGSEAFLDEWLAQPLFATLAASAAHLDERRRAATVAGLAASLRSVGTGSMPWLGDRASHLPMPVLAVAGGLDAKFSAIARSFAASIGPRCTCSIVEQAGHTVHLERPDETASLVAGWLARGVTR